MEPSAYHELNLLEQDHWWFVGRRRLFTLLQRRFAANTDGLRILEVGCGTGGNLTMCSGWGRCIGLDANAAALRQARKKSDVVLIQGRLPHELPFKAGSMDLILAADVLEHIEDDEGSLGALLALLKPGGHLLISVPMWPALWSSHDALCHHKRRYTRRRLLDVIHRSGGECVWLTGYVLVLLPVAFMVRKLLGLEGGLAMPPAWCNRLLARWMCWEARFASAVPVPVGLSLVAVVRLPGAQL